MLDKINEYVNKGFLKTSLSDDGKLMLVNYTLDAMEAGVWDETLKACRGLCVEVATGNIVGRPFAKFFNFGELPVDKQFDIIKNTDTVEISDKLDGTLISVFKYQDKIYTCTRGTFNSIYTDKAKSIFSSKYNGAIESFFEDNSDKTLVFELIFKAGRIVLNYDFEDIFLTGVTDTITGKESSYSDLADYGNYYNLSVVSYKTGKLSDVVMEVMKDTPGIEGFVVYRPECTDGYQRLKFKTETYIKLHRIITNLNTKSVFDYIESCDDVSSLKKQVPEEFWPFIDSVVNNVSDIYNGIITKAKQVLATIPPNAPRAKVADIIISSGFKHVSVAFSLHDNKNPKEYIYKVIRKTYVKECMKNETFENRRLINKVQAIDAITG